MSYVARSKTGLSKEFWYHAIEHVVYDLNHTFKPKDKVLRVNKFLYGLKQSGANWQKTIKDYLKGEFLEIIVCLFVDDIVIAGNNDNTIKQFITDLQNIFDTRTSYVRESSTQSETYAASECLAISKGASTYTTRYIDV